MISRQHLRRIALAALAATAAACAEPAPPAEPRILVIDGIEIRFADVEPYAAFVDTFRPETGTKTKILHVIFDYLLPLRVAQRAFPKERAEQRARAVALTSVATNVAELEQHSALIEHKRRSNLNRTKAQLPVAMFLFDPLHVGGVSPPIEVPQGYYVVGAFDLHESPLVLDDHVDALQVGFVTHDAGSWHEFFEAEKRRLADRCTFVHPDYRDSLPDWIRPPKTP